MRHAAPDPQPHHGHRLDEGAPTMTPGILVAGLRWTFWGLVYLMTFTIALAAFSYVPASPGVRLAMLGVVVFGICVDIVHKRREDAQRLAGPPPR